MGDSALTTFTPNLMPVNQLPHQEADSLNIRGLPLSIMFYNEKLTPEDIRLTLLGSLLLSLMIGVLCYYTLLLRQSPEQALLRGITRNEFFMEYQPVFHTRSGTIGGLEVLIRWQHPIRGHILPNVFILICGKKRTDRTVNPPLIPSDRQGCATISHGITTGSQNRSEHFPCPSQRTLIP